MSTLSSVDVLQTNLQSTLVTVHKTAKLGLYNIIYTRYIIICSFSARRCFMYFSGLCCI